MSQYLFNLQKIVCIYNQINLSLLEARGALRCMQLLCIQVAAQLRENIPQLLLHAFRVKGKPLRSQMAITGHLIHVALKNT